MPLSMFVATWREVEPAHVVYRLSSDGDAPGAVESVLAWPGQHSGLERAVGGYPGQRGGISGWTGR